MTKIKDYHVLFFKCMYLYLSNYRHINTCKMLAGIAPNDNFFSFTAVSWISHAMIASTIGFIDKIEVGDDVMADIGFNI